MNNTNMKIEAQAIDTEAQVTDTEAQAKELEEKKEQNGIVTYKLKKPFTWEGKTYETIDMDFGSLSGKDMDSIEKQILMTEGSLSVSPEFTSSYMFKLAARAAGIHHSVIERMAYEDAYRIKVITRNFIIKGES